MKSAGGHHPDRESLAARAPAVCRMVAAALATTLATAASANEDVLALTAEPANVAMANIAYNGWNFSLLDQITVENVAQLQIAWTWQIDIPGAYEAAPLVIGDTMYVVTPNPNYLYALDLTRDGVIKWQFRPDDVFNRNTELLTSLNGPTRSLAYAEGKIFFATIDGQVFGLDAATGEALWRTVGGNVDSGETLAGNVIVMNKLLVTGNRGLRGKVQAFDIDTGNLQWVMYNMGPPNEVGIGPNYRPYYDATYSDHLTWYGDTWRRGGAGVTGFFTFDPETNMFFYSTGPCAADLPGIQRDYGVLNLNQLGRPAAAAEAGSLCSSIMARDAATGELVWAYNLMPGDPWHLDISQVNLLVDFWGEPAVMQGAANGWFYVLSRKDGRLLTDPWMHTFSNVIRDVDLGTGRPLYVEGWPFTSGERPSPSNGLPVPDYAGTNILWCPGLSSRSGQSDVYSPLSGLLYMVGNTSCMVVDIDEDAVGGPRLRIIDEQLRSFDERAIPNQRAYATAELLAPAGEDNRPPPATLVEATDPFLGRTLWSLRYESPSTAPLLGTAGGLLIHPGNHDCRFRIYDAVYGNELYGVAVGGGFHAAPITYVGFDGRQYIAAIASGRAGTASDAELCPDNPILSRAEATLHVWALP